MTILPFFGGGAGRRLATALLLLAGAILAAPAQAEDDVVASVNGKPITSTEVDMAMNVFGDQLAQIPEDQRRQMVVDALVDMHLVAEAATEAGVADSPQYQARMAFLTAQALRNTYIESEIQDKITEDDIKARYDKDIAGYVAPEEIRVRHILVKTEDEAKKVIADLAAGGDFSAIAKEKSLDPGSKGNGGDLGFFAKGQMVPEFEAAAFALAPGEVTKEPVKTQFGYHVIKLEEKRKQPVPTIDDVRDQVVQMLQRERYQALMAKLRAAATIERPDLPASPAGTAPAAEAPAQQ